MHPFEFIQPILQRRGEFIGWRCGARDRAACSFTELPLCHRAVAGECSIAKDGNRFKVLGHEDRHGDTFSRVDHDRVRKFRDGVAVDPPQIDVIICVGDVLNERALLHAVAAPDAAHDEHANSA